MALAIKSVEHATRLLRDYNQGKRSLEEEAALLAGARAHSAAEFRTMAPERYYQETELLKYELLRWHLSTPRWLFDYRLARRFAPGTVVDFGAGIGLSAFTWANLGFTVTAVESSLESDTTRFGRFLIDRLAIPRVSFTDTIPPGPVDNVVSIETFEHFPDWTVWARRLNDILRPGGRFCATASFEDGHDDRDHPYHFESPVEPHVFLQSLGLRSIARNVWEKSVA